ncbi:hypothetical protein FRC17_006891, partial [Serendipita sp. 399]
MASKQPSTPYNQQPLLKTSQPVYGSSTSNGRPRTSEAALREFVAPEPAGSSITKQVLATIAILLSGGAKLAHVIIHIL